MVNANSDDAAGEQGSISTCHRRSFSTALTAVALIIGTCFLLPASIRQNRNTVNDSPLNGGLFTNDDTTHRKRMLNDPTYYPGSLTVFENGLKLSSGLTSRIIGVSGQRVRYKTGGQSEHLCHELPDHGATFVDRRAINRGGWIYVSNSENRTTGMGGVGAFTFDKDGQIIEYKRLLAGTTANCGGGRTPWKAYITCEETRGGLIYQVDPLGRKHPRVITMGKETNGGLFESFAFYKKNRTSMEFFVTEDHYRGLVRRFIPENPNWADKWNILTGNGTVDFLTVDPVTKTFSWTTDLEAARTNAQRNFPNTEGIEQFGGRLYVVSKVFKTMFILDLKAGTYTNVTTRNGAFDAQPDQVIRILGPTPKEYKKERWLYFTEDGGSRAGIFARNARGQFYTVLENAANPADETTGLSFSPDGKHLYFALQDAGLIFEVTRKDGLPFHATTFNVKYHDAAKKRSR